MVERDDSGDTEVLDAWVVAEPPSGFADRVLVASRGAASASASKEPRRGRWWLAGIAVASVVLALGAVTWLTGDGSDAGQLLAEGRETVSIGARALAVAEAGTSLAWTVEPNGAARVEQTRGDVFYRVEKDGPFAVETPAGRAEARGTSFRVEIVPMGIERQGMIGLAAGAALATAVVVTVYEGRVALANDGGEVTAEAGERVWAREGRPPAEPVDAHEPSSVARTLAAEEEASEAVSRALREEADGLSEPELRERLGVLRDAHGQQQERIETLRGRLVELEAEARRAAAGVGTDPLGGQWYPPDPEAHAALAERCGVRVDSPPVFGIEPGQLGSGEEGKLSLTDAERRAVNDAIQRVHERFVRTLRALYVEATGDASGADALSPRAMLAEIQDKALEGEVGRIYGALSRERAGLRPAPEDLSHASPAERAIRTMAGLGDQMQEVLGQSLGAERAHALRAEAGGWPWARSVFAGCDR